MVQQYNLRVAQIATQPCPNMDKVLQQEFDKGETSGIYQWMKMPEKLIEDLEDNIERLEKEFPLEEHEDA